MQDYHTLFPLDANLDEHEVGSLGVASTKVYKAVRLCGCVLCVSCVCCVRLCVCVCVQR